ncbi:hypothetical protein KKA14_16140 [bacterium]|nr:hypothetical protein [bacterium]
MNIISKLDVFISDDLKKDPVTHSKARTIAGLTILLSFILLLNSFRGFLEDKVKIGFIIAIVSLLFLVALAILKNSKSYFLAGNYLLFLYLTAMTYVIGSTNGISSPIVSAFLPFIFTAFLLIGLRPGIIWGIIALIVVTVIKMMEMNGYEFAALGNNQSYYVNAFANVVNSIILGSIFAFTSENNLNKSVLLRKKAEKEAAEQSLLLTEANSVMNAVAKGDFTKRISMELEGGLGLLKSSVNEAMSMLNETISRVINTSTEILTGTNELTVAAQTLADGTSQQAASIEEVSSSMNEIGSTAKTNNENASQAQTLSAHSTNEIAKGNSQMEAMLKSMTEIKETSSNVSKVIKVIDEIAFQTNLLALNAAVEAARAGKYGKGFAVVADEVRNLAARSAKAAKSTTELIETSIREVEKGVHNAEQTAAILKGFVQSIEKVNDLIGEISSASQEQANSVNEINLSMNQVNQVIQQNSSISEETASSSQELSSLAGTLQALMNNFKIKVGAQRTPEIIPEREPVYRTPARRPVALVENRKPNTLNKIVLDDDEFGKY